MSQTFRPPAVPLVTVDPYFSIWSMADRLYDDHTRHWTTAKQALVGMARIDGRCWRWLGRASDLPSWSHRAEPSGLHQVSLEVRPLSTVAVFEGGGVRLTATFTTPLLLDDLDVLSRPFSYVHVAAQAIDGGSHDVSLYFEATAEIAVNTPEQAVEWKRKEIAGLSVPLIGTWTQNVLGSRGDDLRIDWGYLHLLAPGATATRIGPAAELRAAFRRDGSLPAADAASTRRGVPVVATLPAMAAVASLGAVGSRTAGRLFVLGYDDVASIEYFESKRKAWCFRKGATFDGLAAEAVDEYDALKARCDRFDAELTRRATEAGGEKHAQMLALAYRQAIAAHKLIADDNGDAVFLSKECFSNGCIGTVDVSYPSVPLFLLYAPQLVKGMLRPVLRFAASAAWPRDYAPHDVGTYPRANGQVYGVNIGEIDENRQMPVEECGNMLIMTAAVCRVDASAAFALPHWKQLEKWAAYLLDRGYDPANQLCTDDFAGHLAHNTNLSIKAIIGIACFGEICGLAGRTAERDRHMSAAREMARRWEKEAAEGEPGGAPASHTRLTFVDAGTWSLKYNLVWDRLFGFGLFGPEVARREVAWYLGQRNPYGTPMDSRATFTKTDWVFWAASLAEKQADYEALIAPVWDFANETPCRTPFCDWFGTTDALEHTFHHRSVIGGVFMRLLPPGLRR
jgi:hypothetical protein